jgi:hypothetical protein
MPEQAGDPEESSAGVEAALLAGLRAPGGSDPVAKRLLWGLLAVVGLGVAAVVAVAVVLAGSPTPRQLTVDQYRPGDCLQVPLSLTANSSWPYLATVVPCTQRHAVEVFFTGRLWPRSLPFPGSNVLSGQMTARCDTAFLAYDGSAWSASAFQIAVIGPDKADWPQGIRSVQCVAYSPGESVNYSIKGTHR